SSEATRKVCRNWKRRKRKWIDCDAPWPKPARSSEARERVPSPRSEGSGPRVGRSVGAQSRRELARLAPVRRPRRAQPELLQKPQRLVGVEDAVAIRMLL